MAATRFAERLNGQIANEFAASQQYIAIAIYYDAQTLPRLAAFFYQQAIEERNHALMMVQYLLDADAVVEIPGVTAPTTSFDDAIAPVALALDQERRVSDQIAALMGVARDERDFLSEQFTSWFLKEQVEEVATMSSLLTVIKRSTASMMAVEDYLAREHSSTRGRRSDRAARGRRGALSTRHALSAVDAGLRPSRSGSRAASSCREWIPSLAKMLPRWYSIALVDRYSSAPASRLDRPAATSAATAASRGVSPRSSVPAGVRAHPARRQLHVTSRQQRASAQRLQQLTRRPQSRRGGATTPGSAQEVSVGELERSLRKRRIAERRRILSAHERVTRLRDVPARVREHARSAATSRPNPARTDPAARPPRSSRPACSRASTSSS